LDVGDSGSPVFVWVLPGVNKAWLGGIAVSGALSVGYTFSSITGILDDFGTLGYTMVTY
jgi:hypothetical protein